MRTILVIGGGITGLAAMYELHKWKKETKSDVRLILAEASSELGGKIRSVREGSFIMEAGADSIVARKAETMTFIKELGLEKEVVYNATGRSFIYTEGELKPIPADSVFGIPASIESLARTTLVSPEGKVEALRDFYSGIGQFTSNDSIGAFLEHCFGRELVEKQIAPVLSGVYSGNLRDLTIASTLPYLLDYKEQYGSIIKGFEANKDKFKGGERKFLSFRSGLSRLVEAFESHLEDVELLKNTKALYIEKKGGRYRAGFENDRIIEADHIVVSIPHSAAEKLIVDSELKKEFSKLKNSSLISVYIGFDVPDSDLPAEGTGFIAANTEELSCNACTWTSRKWDHTSKSGNLLVRLFYKSSHPDFAGIKGMNKEQLLQVALGDIEKSMGIKARPLVSEITNWSDQMPNYLISHPKIVKEMENRLAAAFPQIYLAGSSYYGVGIPDCIESGKRTSEKIIEALTK
ncbi:protoporphyrinogen oxidase [Mesobacillus foraminis]|uniref:protoporphyrinogen oxidase n=1 Tax=Mesobacillus foraminis TaxID=279826 RepID=UPI000EF48B5A|nr:protoporphyrinogen oxidase [Mesobacillus foraminis]